jgi:hypothetical protein
MIREQFNEEFKIFKRFLKEDGTYLPIMNYLFRDRGKESLFLAFKNNSLYRGMYFVFSYSELIGSSYKNDDASFEYWKMVIMPINNRWQNYCLEKAKSVFNYV